MLQVNLLHPLASLEWRECSGLPVPLQDAQAVVVNRKIYVGGGWTPSSKDAFVYVSGFMCDSWDVIDSPNYWPAVTTYHNQLVLVGGRDNATDDITEQLWVLQGGQIWTQTIPPMPTRRWGASAVSTGDYLIVAGGEDDYGRLSTVEVYDGHMWVEAESLPIACCDMKSVVHEGNWYLMGGYGQAQIVLYASLDSIVATTLSHSGRTGKSVWKRLPETLHESSSTALFGNCLIATRGESTNEKISPAIHAYSPFTQSWVHVGNIPNPCNFTCTIVLPTGDLLMVGTRLTNRGSLAQVLKATITG